MAKKDLVSGISESQKGGGDGTGSGLAEGTGVIHTLVPSQPSPADLEGLTVAAIARQKQPEEPQVPEFRPPRLWVPLSGSAGDAGPALMDGLIS